MIQIPDPSNLRCLREFLDSQGYNVTELAARFGHARPPGPGDEQHMFDESREITTPNLLARLFLLGARADEATVREFLPPEIVDVCVTSGLLTIRNSVVRAQIVIIPVDDMLFMSDAFHILGSDDAAEFVLPASTHSANFLRLLTMRSSVETTLDIGCGCGIHALFAARHSQTVVATDVSERALLYTRCNAMLNRIDNVECREGSLFEPVAGQRFDLVISNPPFVIGPGEEFVYRDNALELDEFCKQLVREAPAFLNDGGHLQMLCEWVEVAGEAWPDRLASWIRACDAWILHSAPISPQQYVEQRSSDISGASIETGSVPEWTSYFDKHDVSAVHPGMITLRKSDGANWLHVQNLPGDVTTPAGRAVEDGIAAIDFIEACDDESLSEACLTLARNLSAAQMKEGGGIYLRLENGLLTDAEIDAPVAAFINLFNGERSVKQCIAEFAAATDADPDTLGADLLSIIRVFVSRGFLEPIDVA